MVLSKVFVKQGIVCGVEKNNYAVFQGIPFAKPPFGERRFKAPQEPDSWKGVYVADHFPNRSYQPLTAELSFYGKEFYSDPQYETVMSEDCLYLNIWTPAESETDKLPVAFWIHGGSFDHGYGHEKEFDGAAYCKRNVILVTINYRLGALGFLAHPWLTAEDENFRSGNYGSLDQIAALKWVRENIVSFGGDPDNITVFGQSAGSISTQVLISSPLTGKWISKAILQSGISYRTGVFQNTTLADAEKIGREFVDFCGFRTINELKGVDPETLIQKQNDFIKQNPKYILCFSPNIDNYLLVKDLDASIEDGDVKDIPYILGSTKNDIFVTPEMLEEGKLGKLYNSILKLCNVFEKAQRKAPYIYYFSRALPGDDAGSFHSAELWYMFGILERCWRPMRDEDRLLSEQMLDAWTSFMKHGKPKKWKPYTSKEPYVKYFDVDRC